MTLADVLTLHRASSASNESGPSIRAHDLGVRRGREVLFQSLNVTLQPGQCVWLRGSNGSGKTSLLRVLAGLAQPDSGQVLCNEQPLRQSPPYPAQHYPAQHDPAQLLYLGHANALKDDLTASEALRFLSALQGRNCTPLQLQAALRRLGVFHRRKLLVRLLSQGQRRRVALARLALQDQAAVWLLDEPFDALDDAGIAVVLTLLQENLARGGSVLFTSHIAVRSDSISVAELNLQAQGVCP